jgi:hypothetical protein
LPRGNQADVATSIHRHALTSHEAAQLVTLFARTSGAAQQRCLLDQPREALSAQRPREPAPALAPRLGPETQALHQRLCGASRASSDLWARLVASALARWTPTERQALLPLLTQTHECMTLVLGRLSEIIEATRRTDVG